MTAHEYYPFDEAARLLRIDAATLRDWVDDGAIRAYQRGDVVKFRKSDVDKIVAERGKTISEVNFADEASAFNELGETYTEDAPLHGSGDSQVDIAGPADSDEESFLEETIADDDGIAMTAESADLDLAAPVEGDDDEAEADMARPLDDSLFRAPLQKRADELRKKRDAQQDSE